jgi:predicted aspartyl protease
MHRSTIAVLAALMMFFGSTGGARAEIVAETGMTRSDEGSFLVEIMVDGEGPYTALIDTGSVDTIILAGFIRSRGLEPLQRGGASAHSGSGMVSLEYFRLETITLGDLVVENLVVMGLDDAYSTLLGDDIDMIIGIDVFGEFIIEFDQAESQFRLYSRDADLTSRIDGWAEMPFETGLAGLSFTQVTLNGAPVRALFDTGSAGNIVNSRAGRAAGYLEGDPRMSATGGQVRGLGGAPTPVSELSGVRVEWGEVVWPDFTISQSDAAAFDMLRMGGQPAMILGLALFGDHDFIVDYTRMRILIGPRAGH